MAAALRALSVPLPEALGGSTPEVEMSGHMENPDGHFGVEYRTLLFLVCVWSVGKVFARLGMPALLGEIAVGIVMGPQVTDVTPRSGSLELYGEIGLMLLMMEAGLHVDVEMLQIVGLRAVAVGLLGSLLPMLMCFPIAVFAFDLSALEAFAVSSTLATMSTGIALNVLKAGGALNQPTGQLIIAAATVNEMVNIGLITELEAISSHGRWSSYVSPLAIMFVLVGFVGLTAIKAVPWLLDKVLLPRVSRNSRENLVLGLMFAMALLLMPLCKVTGSSDLLGAFLAGFCFCTDQHVHHAWNRQVKRVAAFLMRLFFACSIGFSIPVMDFADSMIWRRSGLLFTCIVTKIGMGVFARPLDKRQFCVLGFAWGAWGEFSFILAVHARAGGLMGKVMYDSIVLTVLLSVVLSPMALRWTLMKISKDAEKEIDLARRDTNVDEIGKIHNVYYCLQTRSKACWGQQEALLSSIFASGCKVIDFRTFHPMHHVGSAHVVNELYLKDEELKLCVAEQLESGDQATLDTRIGRIIDSVEEALSGSDPKITISRWLPGEGTQELVLALERGGDASPGAALEHLASRDAFRNLQAKSRRHITDMALALENDTSQPLTPPYNHELDGFVHWGEHGHEAHRQDHFRLTDRDDSTDVCLHPDQHSGCTGQGNTDVLFV